MKINDSMLRRWVKELQDRHEQAFPGKGHQTVELEELARLKRENKRLTMEFETRFHAQKAITEYIDFYYNTKRRHSTNGLKSPRAYELMNVA